MQGMKQPWKLIFSLLVLAAGCVGGEPFRFAFLSDTHVGSATGAEDLRLAVHDLNSMTGLSFVVVSGDITEYGSREQFRLAKEIFDGLKLPTYIIPGNHDAKWSESGATDFARIFPSERFVFEFGGYRFIGMYEGPVMKMGDGFWAPEDVRWLAKTLQELPDRNEPLVFVTHYPINDSIANWYEVLDLLKKYNTQIVLCGHGHSNHDLNFEGVPAVMGRSTLRAKKPAGGFNIVEFSAGRATFSEHVLGGETQAPWDTVVLEKHDYAAMTNYFARPDFSTNAAYPAVKEKWVRDTGWLIASSPALWRNSVLLGDASGNFSSFSLENGAPEWSLKTGNAIYSTPAVQSNLVVFASTDGNVYALDLPGGHEHWRFHSQRPIVATPLIHDGSVFIGSSEGKFWSLNLNDGKPRWEFPDVAGFIETRALLYQDQVIFGAWDENLYALDAKTGLLNWKWKGDRRGALLSPAACWPIGAAGKVFIVAPDRKMTALEAKTGKEIWRTGEGTARESLGLSEDATRFYVRSMNDYFYAFSTQAAAPELIWKTDAHFGYDINSAMLAEKDGTVFYGTKNGQLFALNGKDGSIRWQHKFGVGVMNTPVPLSADKVLVTDFDGKIALIENLAMEK